MIKSYPCPCKIQALKHSSIFNIWSRLRCFNLFVEIRSQQFSLSVRNSLWICYSCIHYLLGQSFNLNASAAPSKLMNRQWVPEIHVSWGGGLIMCGGEFIVFEIIVKWYGNANRSGNHHTSNYTFGTINDEYCAWLTVSRDNCIPIIES